MSTDINVVEQSYPINVTASRSSTGQVVPVNSVTFEAIVTNLSDLALEYSVGGGAWHRLLKGKSRRVQANLQTSTLRLRKGADISGGASAQVTTLSNGGQQDGKVVYRTGGRTVLFGSSSMQRHTETGSAGGIPRLATSAKGPFNIMNNMLRNRFTLAANLGIGGQTTAQLKARLDEVFTYNPDIVWFHAGTNDLFINGTTADIVYRDAKHCLDEIRARGIRVVLCGPQKWQSTDPDVTPTKFGEYFKYLDLLEAYAKTNDGVLWMNWAEAVVDKASATGDQKATAFEDTKHLSNLGAMLVAMKHLSKLDAFTQGVLQNQDEQVNRMPDPYMLVTKAATAPVTGTTWNGFDVVRLAGNCAIACSMTGSPDGRGFAQRVVVTSAVANDRVNLNIASSIILPLVSAGERMVFEMDIEFDSYTNLRAFPIYMARNSGNMNIIGNGRDLNTAANDKTFPAGMPAMQLQTVVYDVPAGTTQLTASLSLLFNGAGGCDCRVWNPRIRVVPSAPVAVV